MSKLVKRLLKSTLALVVLLIGLAIAIPYFFKDDIVARIKTEANNALNATLDFGEVELSLLRSFPNFSFGMEDFSLVGIDQFEGVPLVNAKDMSFTLDIMSVIKSDRPIEIESVTFDQPNVNILVLSDGHANYDIAKPTEDTTAAAEYDFLIQLKNYAINEGNITYDDRVGGIFLEIKNLNHSGRGDFTQDIFDLVTTTSIEQLTAVSGGIPYLKKANAELEATFNIDMPNSKYTLKDNSLQINAMKLLADGFVQMPNEEDIDIDFTFSAPKNDFKNLLSLIPSAFTQDFSSVKTNGQMAFDGYVKGTYNGTKGTLPAFKISLNVDQGSFQYPDLPMGIKNIFAKMSVESPSSNLDKMKIDIPNFKFALGDEPFEGKFKLTTPISDPNIDTKLKGIINLANINKAFPLDGVSELSGIINADMVAQTRMSTIEKGDYAAANVDGRTAIKNLVYVAEGLPKVMINDTKVEFTPNRVILENFDAKIGKSDMIVSGSFDNILAYFSPEKTMTGNIKLRSKYFNADEWMSEEAAEPTPAPEAEATEIFDRFKFAFDAKIGEIDYDVYELKNSSSTGTFSSNELKINDFETLLGASDLRGNGTLTNIFNYVFENETLRGQLALQSDFFDLNPFMEEEATTEAKNIANTGEEELEPIVIPDNVDVSVKANIKKLVYTNLDLKDFSGGLTVKDSRVEMQDVSARMLGGKFETNGYYDTKTPEKPKYKLDYNVNSFGYQSAFSKFVTIQQLAPIANYIQGNFSTDFSIEGAMDQNFMPDFNTLFAKGFLQTTEGFIKGFKPLQKVGEALGVSKLKDHKINLKGTKNWFEVKEGKVVVKEFPLEYQGIDMQIGGSHGLTQEIDYLIKAKIPSKLMNQNAVGAAAKQGLASLNDQAKKLGLNLGLGEFINVNINVTGSMSSPNLKFNLVGSEGQSVKEAVVNTIKEVKDSVTTVVTNKIEATKEDLSAKVKARKDALEREANAKIKQLTDAADKSAASIRSEGKKLAQKFKAEGYEQADVLVEKAGINPFKKKAAEIAAKKLKNETDEKAQKIETEANEKADNVVNEADKKALQIKKEYQKKIDAVNEDNI